MEKRNFTAEYEQLLKAAHDHVEKKIRTEGKWTEDGLIVKGDFACEENEEDHDIYAYVGDAPAPFDLYHEEKDIFSIADSL